jgi:perosamine synthetase
VGVFSFHGSKTLTTGEGGMLVSDREDIYRRALALADHGREPDDKSFRNLEVAHKYKMSSLQAALGLAQLERIEELMARKRQIFAWYESELARVKGVALNPSVPGTDNAYWMVTAIIDQHFGIRKERLVELMGESNIDCRPFFYPLSSLPAYQDSQQARVAQESNKASYEVSPYGINLPSALNLTEDNIAYVAQALRRILRR